MNRDASSQRPDTMFEQCDNCGGLFKNEAELEVHKKFDDCSEQDVDFSRGDLE